MGSYLSEPIIDKHSTDESNDRLSFGASSMQGWRLSQEDAHNAILDFDKLTSLFAVYDGHGGHEVALYCSTKLPEFIKERAAYHKGNLEEALIEGFLDFDKTIASPEVIDLLKEIAGERDGQDDVDDEDEENVSNLREEADMPIEQVIEKYTSILVNPSVKNLRRDEKYSKSPCLKAKKDADEGAVGTSTSSVKSPLASSSSSSSSTSSSSRSSSNHLYNDGDGVSSSSRETDEVIEPEASKEANGSSGVADTKATSPDSSQEAAGAASPSSSSAATQNGERPVADSEAQAKNDVTSSVVENGETVFSKKGKGKAKAKSAIIKPVSVRPKRDAQEIYKHLLDEDVDSDESDEDDDQTFQEPDDYSSNDDDYEEEVEDKADNDDSSREADDEDSFDACGDDDDDDDDEGEEEDEEEDDPQGLSFVKNMKEEPGSNSGCTAVVALLKDNELYVANAGDSRCVVCRNGRAVEMSIDHKPEDEPERERIEKAGGKVTNDGRVNGGLNLSRAIGDHAYKQNQELSDREQMITALPDVQKLTIDPDEDEFMVLACDGIWNFMSSQQVVDFVRRRINPNTKLSAICEALFEHCLAPCTLGDGTGCDNMTAIIVKFNNPNQASNILKRSASDDLEENVKRAKTDDNSERHIDTTA